MEGKHTDAVAPVLQGTGAVLQQSAFFLLNRRKQARNIGYINEIKQFIFLHNIQDRN